jgi:predicted GNAT family acetyltransferase
VLLNAVDRYDDWEAINPNASPEAREKMIWELHRLYRLQNYPQFIRLQLYSMTYFKQTDNNFQNAFSKLLKKIKNEPDLPLTNFMELSELQNLVKNVDDRKVFSRMIFPYPLNTGKVELKQFGDKDTKQIVLTSNITDNENHIYTVREPVTPVEIGKLYRLFYIEKYPKSISNQDRCLVVIDENEKIIGGICYKMQDNNSVMIDGTVVFTPLKGKGIGKAMIEDFYSRMKINGKKAITTHFFLQQFYKKLGFEVNEKWGALVRFIS